MRQPHFVERVENKVVARTGGGFAVVRGREHAARRIAAGAGPQSVGFANHPRADIADKSIEIGWFGNQRGIGPLGRAQKLQRVLGQRLDGIQARQQAVVRSVLLGQEAVVLDVRQAFFAHQAFDLAFGFLAIPRVRQRHAGKPQTALVARLPRGPDDVVAVGLGPGVVEHVGIHLARRDPQAQFAAGGFHQRPDVAKSVGKLLTVDLPDGALVAPSGVGGHQVEEDAVRVEELLFEGAHQRHGRFRLLVGGGERPPGVVAGQHARRRETYVFDVVEERFARTIRLGGPDDGRMQRNPAGPHLLAAGTADKRESRGRNFVECGDEFDARPEVVAEDRMAAVGITVLADGLPIACNAAPVLQRGADQAPLAARRQSHRYLLSQVVSVGRRGITDLDLHLRACITHAQGLRGALDHPGVQIRRSRPGAVEKLQREFFRGKLDSFASGLLNELALHHARGCERQAEFEQMVSHAERACAGRGHGAGRSACQKPLAPVQVLLTHPSSPGHRGCSAPYRARSEALHWSE